MIDGYPRFEKVGDQYRIYTKRGVYLVVEGLNCLGDTFTITDYTGGAMQGRTWTVRYDHIDEDFAEFVEEFEMLEEMRKPKPLTAEEPTGTWYHGEDDMSVWVPKGKTLEEVLEKNARHEAEIAQQTRQHDVGDQIL